jgi:hypothetical protein
MGYAIAIMVRITYRPTNASIQNEGIKFSKQCAEKGKVQFIAAISGSMKISSCTLNKKNLWQQKHKIT